MALSHVTRRGFLTISAAHLALVSRPTMAAGPPDESPLRLAVFGTLYNAQHFLVASHIYNATVVALVDPDSSHLAKTKGDWKAIALRLGESERPEERRWADHYALLAEGEGVSFYSDIRQLFDERADDFDALVVSHYDHLHAIACGPAMRLGKPVCTERPLGLNLFDARRLRLQARETSLPVVYRSPGTASDEFRWGVELVRDGGIGSVQEVHVWFDRGGPDIQVPPHGKRAAPDGLNWDAWLGPLPWRDFHPDWMAYARWRETSNGGLGTFGPHTMIFPFLALELSELWSPDIGARDEETRIRVQAECSGRNELSFPRWERIRWEIPARGDLPPVAIHWHHGPDFAPGTRQSLHKQLRRVGIGDAKEADRLMAGAGSMLIGSEGVLVGDDHSVKITPLPAERFADGLSKRPQRLPPSQGLYRDWIDTIRGGQSRVMADFETGGFLSELLMLGNIATLEPGAIIEYSPSTGEIQGPRPNDSTHQRLAYREGWHL